MNLQQERIAALCTQLKLERIADHYPHLAQEAVREDLSYADFLERLLQHEKRLPPNQDALTADAHGLLPGHQDAGRL